jgi:allophanate hydrolase
VADTIAELVKAHRARATTPEETVVRTFHKIRAHDDPAVFISLRDEAEVRSEARTMAEARAAGPLYGVPVAIKDNIDVKGMATTAACPAFAYAPAADASVVARLRRAGAIVIGKTNLDQFATGLVGTRSPYGVPRNPLNSKLIPGGSSSGSAIAVSAGLVPLALGTDTAGSGRVPAALNNIVGLKPSLGLVPTAGVVPACRTLDCVSVFSLTADDAFTALTAIAGYDPADPYSQHRTLAKLGGMPPGVRVGIPLQEQRVFFGDVFSSAAYEQALAGLLQRGGVLVKVDFEPFYQTARLLYEGPWLAERYIAVSALMASSPADMHPTTREVIAGGVKPTAVEAFSAFYKLAEYRRACERVFEAVDVLVVPSVPTTYTIEELLNDPIALNSRLGTYTNFVNLLDLCGLAVPAALRADGIAFGVTLLAPSGRDALLATIGRVFHHDTGLPLGALGLPQPSLPDVPATAAADEVAVAVVGLHLSGMPLNGELLALGARFLETTTTSPDYRLYALGTGALPKPGLLRVADDRGTAVEVEVWALPEGAFGAFIRRVREPLTIGTVRLAGGRSAHGFLMESQAASGARDISELGGWRKYVAALAA